MLKRGRRVGRKALALVWIALLLVACGSEMPTAIDPTGSGPAATPARAGAIPAPATTRTPLPSATPPPPPTRTPLPPTPTTPGDASDIDDYLLSLEKGNAFTGSVLVARDGEVLLAKGYGLADRDAGLPNTPQTKFRICSVTKQFTAMAILLLQAQGKLNVRDRVCDYLAGCPATWKRISLHHLLTHTSGIPDFVGLGDYEATKGTPTTPLELISRVKDRPLEFAPGERWSYSNSGYVLLGYVIEVVSGQPYGEFVEQNILEPLAMSGSGYNHNQAVLARGYTGEGEDWRDADDIDASVPYAAGALYSTVEDLYRWDQALYGERLISQELLDVMFTPFARSPIGDFGYGWIISTEGGRSFVRHGGGGDGFTSLIARYPDGRVTIILLSNRDTTDLGSILSTISDQVWGGAP